MLLVLMIIQSSLNARADNKPHFGTVGPRKFIFLLVNRVYFNSLPSNRQRLLRGGNRCLHSDQISGFLKCQEPFFLVSKERGALGQRVMLSYT